MLTCLNGYFVEPGTSFGESALFAPMAVRFAVWASSGLTTPDVQEIMAKRFYKNFPEGSIPRLEIWSTRQTVIPIRAECPSSMGSSARRPDAEGQIIFNSANTMRAVILLLFFLGAKPKMNI